MMGKFADLIAFHIYSFDHLANLYIWPFKAAVNIHILCLSHFMHHIHQSWLGNYFVILPQNIIKIYWSLFPTNNCFIIEIETTWLKGLWLGWMALRPPWQRKEGPAASPWKRGPGLPGKQWMLRAADTELLLQSHRAPSSRTRKPAKAEEGRWRHRPAHWNQHLVETRWRGGPAQSWLERRGSSAPLLMHETQSQFPLWGFSLAGLQLLQAAGEGIRGWKRRNAPCLSISTSLPLQVN